MPLSRHFYSIDEVQSSLYHSVSLGRVEESLFWCQELIDSGYIGETISILFESWLWSIGPFCIQWLLNSSKTLSSEELSETDILNATYQLACIPNRLRDSSLWNILVLGSDTSKIPDRLVRKYPVEWASKNNVYETHFIGAIYQGKSVNAWWISTFIDNKRVWELLKWYASNVISSKFRQGYLDYFDVLSKYSDLLGFQSDECDIVIRCVAICSLCISDLSKKDSFDEKWIKYIDRRIRQNMDIWAENLGRKSRRVFKIQTSYLYGKTQRGEMRWLQNTLQQLYDAEQYLVGCPFWDEAISEYATLLDIEKEGKGVIQWNSDEIREEFYDKYFPDDIPDEWDKEEKLKSHGDGILSPTDVTNIWKYSRQIFSEKSRLLWGSKSKVEKFLEKDKGNYSDCNLYSYIGMLYNNSSRELNILHNLYPVHKIKRIIGYS